MGAQQLLPPPLSVPFPPNHHHPGQQLFNNRFICIFVFFLTKLFALHSDLVHHVPIHTYIYAILFVLPILWAQMDCVCVCVCVCLHKRIFLWNRNKTPFWFCFQFNWTPHFISFDSFVYVFFTCWLPVFFCSTNAHCWDHRYDVSENCFLTFYIPYVYIIGM